jgi:hypothetical protein
VPANQGWVTGAKRARLFGGGLFSGATGYTRGCSRGCWFPSELDGAPVPFCSLAPTGRQPCVKC